MNNKPIKLFSASAGAGKTYTLTIEYIKLALKEFEARGYFRRILAVTFTNKAAEEMKRRIIDFLYLIAKNDFLKHTNHPKIKDSEEIIVKILSDFKNEKLDLTRDELIKRANYTLKQILQDYGLFSVMTIDSFVQKLSQSFIEELNLPDQFEVNLDSNQLIQDVLNEVLDQINQNSSIDLKQAILDFALQEVEEEKSWNGLRDGLQNFLKILFQEDYLEKERLIQQFDVSDFQKIEENIIEFEELSLSRLVDDARKVIELIESNHLEISDFTQGSRGPIADFYKFIQVPQLQGNSYAYMLSAIQAGKWEAGKINSIKKDSIHSISTTLTDLANDFYTTYQKASQKNALLGLIKKNLRKFALLNHIQQELNQFQIENGIISISDFSKKINQIVSNDPLPFIYEKLGERYHHILIDEFQDTSILQWKNFMPLLEHTTSYRFTNLIVGDAKQSIYKFRGGEVGLIASLFAQQISFVDKKFEENSLDKLRFTEIIQSIQPKNLKENYRSSFEIVNFNNSLFQWIHQHSAIKEKYPLIDQVYGNHLTQEAKSPIYDQSTISCNFYVVNADKIYSVEEEKKWNLDEVCKIITRSLNNKYSYKDIAILTRGNKEANYLAIELKKMGIPLTSSDSLLLYYSPTIRFIKSCLAFKLDPNSRIREFELRTNYQKLSNTLFVNNIEFSFLFQKQNFQIKSFIQSIIHHFQLMSIPSEVPYLLKLIDILEDYTLKNNNSIDDFLTYFEQNKYSISINGNESLDAITISTIHKSKGLEYPVVILGFANWSLTPNRGAIWVDFDEETEFSELHAGKKYLSTHYLPIQSKHYSPYGSLSNQIENEHQLASLEAINMLYVATTRSKYDLYILSKFVEEDAPKRLVNDYHSAVSNLLYSYASSSSAEMCKNERSSEYVFCSYNGSTNQKEFDSIKNSKSIVANRSLEMGLSLRHSRTFDENFTDSVQKREIGNVIHNLIAKNDLSELKNKINQLAADTSIQKIVDINSISTFINHPNNYFLFENNHLILAEQDIITADGTIYRPDRVVKLNDTYVIIDYKTGKPAEKHRSQIENYKNLMKDVGFLPVIGKLVYFEEGRIEDV